MKITGPGWPAVWMTLLELQTADRGAPRGVPTAAQGRSLPTHWNHRPLVTWTWRACRGAPAYSNCPPSDSSGQMRRCIQVFFGDACSPKRNNFWHDRQGFDTHPSHSCVFGQWISLFSSRPDTSPSECGSRSRGLAGRRQVDHQGRQKGDNDVVMYNLCLMRLSDLCNRADRG